MAKRTLLGIVALGSIVALALLGGCGSVEDDQLASVGQESHSWNGYHWARTRNPFTLKVGDNVSGAWDSVLNTTIADWSQSTVVDLTKVAGGARPKNCRPTSGQDEVCNSSYGNTGWLGIAQIWVSGSHITQGTTKLNDFYFNTAQYNTTAWRNLVSCQEVGHTLGLAHQDENFNNANLGTCMDYTNDPSTNQHPNKHDYDELVTIYTHLDSTTTVGQIVNTAPAAVGGSGHALDVGNGVREDVGEVIGHGNHWTMFYKGLGGENAIVTSVTWAD